MLGAVFEPLVAFFLQLREVERLLWKLLLLLRIDFCNRDIGWRTAPCHHGVRTGLFFENSNFIFCEVLCLESFPSSDDTIVIQFLELLHDGVAFHDQVQGRRLHASHRNHFPATGRQGVGSRGVQPDHPVGSLSQTGCVAQVHALRGIFQIFPGLVEVLCHVAVDPESLDGLLLEGGGVVEDQVENQVSFASGIRAVHENVRLLHHLPHHVQLLLCAFDFH